MGVTYAMLRPALVVHRSWFSCRALIPSSRRFTFGELRNFLELSYQKLEKSNVEAKEEREQGIDPDTIQEERFK